MMVTRVMRPALRYPGSKMRMMPWLLEFVPTHTTAVDVFGGSGSFILSKAPSAIEVYNDRNDDVVNFFWVLRERTDELIRAIRLTPYARRELARAREPQAGLPDLERARRFYVLSWQSFYGVIDDETSGWRVEHTTKRNKMNITDWNELDRLEAVASRLKSVYIECCDAFDLIRRYDAADTFFYCDPPYLQHTLDRRWTWRNYAIRFTDRQHAELAECLSSIRGTAIISGYRSKEYAVWLEERGWKRYDKLVRTNYSARHVESIWVSPNASRGMKQKSFL